MVEEPLPGSERRHGQSRAFDVVETLRLPRERSHRDNGELRRHTVAVERRQPEDLVAHPEPRARPDRLDDS